MDFFGPYAFWKSRIKSVFNLNGISASTLFNNYSSDKDKLAAVLQSPALLKVFKLQCDLFSLGQVYVYDKDENEIEEDPFLELIRNPNPFQSQSQFLWDFMFWNMLGTAYCYVDSALIDNQKNKLYFLMPYKMEWPNDMQKDADKLIFSDATVKAYKGKTIRYRYDDGTKFDFALDKLIIATDITNGIGNWFKGPSSLDALFKIVTNSEHALDAKNINVRFSGKFLVGSANTLQAVGLGDEEKKDIIQKIETPDQKVWPLKTMVQIRRFVDDLGALALDPAYMNDYFLIGSMFNIPKDVLEAYNQSSTFENQEKARMSHVAYCLQPKGNDFMNGFERKFGYNLLGKNIWLDWSHLPFMQVFEKEKAEVQKTKIDSFRELIASGVPEDQANQYLETNFVIPTPEKTAADNSDPATLEAQASLRGSVGGVQGILAVQASVGAGTTSREAALSILTIIYGFTEQQANNLLGEPQEAQSQGSGFN